MLESIEGIVVREKDYGESSKIIDVFTRKYGLISIIARGSKKVKSNISFVSSKLTYGNFNVFYKKNKLSILNSVDVIVNLRDLKNDITKIGYSTYLCELVSQVSKQLSDENDIISLYDTFISAILKINDGFDVVVITNIFELKILDYLGVAPTLDRCVMCNSANSIVTISVDRYGLLCKNCRTNERLLDINTIKHLRMYYYVDISKISKLDIDDNVKKEVDIFLNDYFEKHTGLYLQTKAFINNIKKLGC